jgi:hypothetical protein
MRDRRLLAGAVGPLALGDFLGFIPLRSVVQERTGSGIAVAGLFIALWRRRCPRGPAGLLADRVESRRLLRDVSLAQAAIAAVLCLRLRRPRRDASRITALLGVRRRARPSRPSSRSAPPSPGPDGVAQVNGRIEAARYLGFTLGPVLGGLLAAAGGHARSRCSSTPRASWPSPSPRRRCGRGVSPARATLAERARDRLDLPLATTGVLAPGRSSPRCVAALHDAPRRRAEVFFAKDVLHAGDTGYGVAHDAVDAGHGRSARRVVAVARAGRRLRTGLRSRRWRCRARGLALPTLWLVLPFALGALPRRRRRARHEERPRAATLIHTRVPGRAARRAWAAYSAGRNGAS